MAGSPFHFQYFPRNVAPGNVVPRSSSTGSADSPEARIAATPFPGGLESTNSRSRSTAPSVMCLESGSESSSNSECEISTSAGSAESNSKSGFDGSGERGSVNGWLSTVGCRDSVGADRASGDSCRPAERVPSSDSGDWDSGDWDSGDWVKK